LDREVFRGLLESMGEAQTHRGPDGRGIFISPDEKVGLAHTRLAIIDLSRSGNQPMRGGSGEVWISFNGEIYNFPELRAELERAGVIFRSRSDTEVILELFSRYGASSFNRLRGMFALALYDGPTGDLFLVRDRFGIKPLYYAEGNGEIVFASNVKTLLESERVRREPDPLAPAAFLLSGSLPHPMTTLRDVRCLPPGSYARFSGGKLSVHSFYTLDFSKKTEITQAEAARELRRLIEEAVVSHLLSDAPLGVFLSGGIDSSLLTALAAAYRNEPVTTLSVNFPDREFDEGPHQLAVASRCGTDHRTVRVTPEEVLARLPAFFGAMDQPSIDGLNTYVVSWAARKAGLKAVLSGVGGDELFGGYPFVRKYPWVKALLRFRPIVKGTAALLGSRYPKFHRLGGTMGHRSFGAYLAFRGLFGERELAPVFGEEQVNGALEILAEPSRRLTSRIPADEIAELDIECYLRNQLLKDSDALGMAHSIEIRVPFLDHPLVDFISALPANVRASGTAPKPLLARACGDLLPGEIWTRRKQGFTFPFERWMRRELKAEFRKTAFADPRQQAFFRKSLDGFLAGREHWSRPYAWYVLSRYLPGG
jgi:asparagine synthase (glutamine-hydrolysing)